MAKKINQFFKMIKYELKRVSRNKVILAMLLGFSIVLLLFVASMKESTKKCKVAINLNGVDIESLDMLDILDKKIAINDLTYVNSLDEGKDLIKHNKIDLFIEINADVDPITATVFYDMSSNVGRSIKNDITQKQTEYSYKAVKEALQEYGITINEGYFNAVSFKSTSDKPLTIKQYPFSIEIATCLSIILMFGLAYSLSRDNETNVSRNINYIPIGKNRYLLSKVIPYILLALLETIIIFAMGGLFFKINYSVNVSIVILCTLLFSLATIMVGLMFSMMKSQIATIFCDMLFILLPVFVLTSSFVKSFPFMIQCVLYCMPITSFIPFVNCLMYNGTILWWAIGAFILQIIAYYLITFFILNKKTYKKR